jgi:hypothetical protein
VKTKTWKVVSNSGKRADLESGVEKLEFNRPPHIRPRDFVYWVTPGSNIDDTALKSLFKQ